jgi:flagellar M-ring protein FliF
LSRPSRGSLEGQQVSEAALDYRQSLERELTAKINNTLEPLLGADRFRTGVSADVDMTSGEQNEETFDPAKSVMVTSQKTEDTNSVTHVAPGPPGTAANLPQPQRPAGNTTGTVRRTESVSYQTSRTTKHVQLPQGVVKRLSVAVLLDQTVKWEGQGPKMHRVLAPPEPEKLKTIQALVSTLVGLNTERGDQITVETLPFDATLNMEPPSPAQPGQDKKPADGFSLEAIKNKPVIWGSAAGGIALIILLVVMLGRGKGGSARVEVTHALPQSVGRALTPTGSQPSETERAVNQESTPASRMAALLPSRTEVLLTQLQENGKNSPELWAGILRSWLSEEESG